MAERIYQMKYEFFSWRGFAVGAITIGLAFLFQSIISFPEIWFERGFGYTILIVISAMVVGVASGAILVYLFPPDQDVIGVAGLGSDDAAQHVSLFLILISLVMPLLSAFVFFFDYFGEDPLILIWVIIGFLAPSLGLTVSMFDRTNRISNDLESYFKNHSRLDISTLPWLMGQGPRTSTYRMGMLESAVKRVQYLAIHGHEIVKKETDRRYISH
jgi:ABC-type amino acid transport system permease subunit